MSGALASAQEPRITAASALLFDARTGKVLYKKNENDQRAVASTQKLLTSLIVAEDGELSRPIEIAPEIAEDPLIFPDDETLARTFGFAALSEEVEAEYDAAFSRIIGA